MYLPSARKKTVAVKVGNVTIGGGAPVAVQSMTNTDTANADATVQQILDLARSGSELVRITVNNPESAAQVAHIKEKLLQKNCAAPIIGDFHYNGHQLLKKYPECAEALSKYRINPGNVGFGRNKDSHFSAIVETAIQHDKPIRIGVNWGSLDKALLTKMMDENSKQSVPLSAPEVMHNALVESVISSAQQAMDVGIARDRIVLSCKVSDVQSLVAVYSQLAKQTDHALHLGLTEAGMGNKGIISSTAGLSILLQKGIGDTIRVSLTPKPNGDRTEEVVVAQEILQAMGLRAFVPQVIACPGCGRTTSVVFQELANSIQEHVRTQMPIWKTQYPGVENMKLAVMGCVVNGPGESKHADIGISLPGTGEEPSAPVFIDGEKSVTLKGENIAERFQAIMEHYIQERYGQGKNKTPPQNAQPS